MIDQNTQCRICGHPAPEFARARIINKYDIRYFCCNVCGFVQTENPYWLKEVYTEVINDSDIGLVSRNISSAEITKAIILAFFDRSLRFVDYGGGYGLFVRMMRDKGFAFNLYDIFCENIFAKGFEVEPELSGKYELLTAFEVFEHLVDPLEEIEKMLQFSENILFSTALFPKSKPMPGEWWYYGLDHGQHISIYSYKSLKYIANRYNLNLYTDKHTIHLLTKKKIHPLIFQATANPKVSRVIDLAVRRKSLMTQDYFQITRSKLD